MTAPPSADSPPRAPVARKPPAALHPGMVAGVTLLLGGVALLVLTPWKSGGVQKVRDDFPGGRAWFVRGGQLVQVREEPDVFVVTAAPVSGGATRTLYRATLTRGETFAGELTSVVDNAVWLHRSRTPPGPLRPEFALSYSFSGDKVARDEFADFRQPDAPVVSRPGDSLTARPLNLPPPETHWRVVRVPLEPVTPEIAPVEARPNSDAGRLVHRAVAGEVAYWTETTARDYTVYETDLPAKGGANAGRPPRLFASLYPPATILYARPFAPPGPARRLADGLATVPHFQLNTLPDGVTFVQPRPYPDRRRDALVFRAPDYRPLRLPDYRGFRPPVLARGRLWWLEWGRAGAEESEPRVYLASVEARSGGERRGTPLPDAPDGQKPSDVNLSAYDDRLYLNYRTVKILNAAGEGQTRAETFWLALLDPDAPEEGLRPFLSGPSDFGPVSPGRADDGYFYFATREEQASLLDVFSERNTARSIPCLYRIRLPR